MLGNGDDVFIWDPGDGSDVVEGQKGFDTMVFNGAAAAEHFDLIANVWGPETSMRLAFWTAGWRALTTSLRSSVFSE